MLRYSLSLFILSATAICFATAQSCEIMQSGVTPQQKAEILEAHNRLRAAVAMGLQSGQPGAQNMKELVWDNELASRAQGWANQCTFKHDPERNSQRFIMGQNMAIIWSTAPIGDGDFSSRISNWFKEVNQYSFGSSWSPKTGHYSQLVWADTNMVGCGFSYYKSGGKYNKLFVCNYGPGGNVVGSMPYSVGNPDCNGHGLGPSGRYPGLCTSRGSGGGLSNFGGQSYNSFGGYPSSTVPPQTYVSSTYAPQTYRSTTLAPQTYRSSTAASQRFRSSSFAPSSFGSSFGTSFGSSKFRSTTLAPPAFRSSTFAPSSFRSSTFAPSSFRSSTFAPSTFRSSTFAPRAYQSRGAFSTPFPSASPNYSSFKNYFNSPPKPSFAPAWNSLQFGLYKKK